MHKHTDGCARREGAIAKKDRMIDKPTLNIYFCRTCLLLGTSLYSQSAQDANDPLSTVIPSSQFSCY